VTGTAPGGSSPPLVKSSDGPVSVLLNRRISQPVSAFLAPRGVTPNMATLAALAIGLAGCAALALQVWWLGGILIQLSSIFAGVDGEIARRTGASSTYGDFLDTVTDRLVEYTTFAAIAYGLAQTDRWESWAWPLGALAIGGTFMLASASEKYRSVMHENYPKRQFEPFFAYLASGRDVRVFYLAIAAILATWRVDVLAWVLIAVTAVMHVNWLYRLVILRTRMQRDVE
jgi:1L-myo-inositol 1-phosphate cytidylyltransferase / CDP-L-myo-inositol myo-inositolphosphotransferase